jgi:hypothetical protein
MCVPPAVLAFITTAATVAQTMRRSQTQNTPQIVRNEIPRPVSTSLRAASGPLDPDKIRKEDEDITLASSLKQKKDRKRVREGLKTLGAVDPVSQGLPSAPDQGIATT